MGSLFKKFVLASQGENLEKLCDTDGNPIMADLPDGTRLRWRQMVNPMNYMMGSYNAVVTVKDGVYSLSSKLQSDGTYRYFLLFEQKANVFKGIIGHLIFSKSYAKVYDNSTGITYRLMTGSYISIIDSNITNRNLSDGTIEATAFGIINSNADTTGSCGWHFRANAKDISLPVSGDYFAKDAYLLDLTEMFSLCPSLLPSSTDVFWSEGIEASKELGYTPYTDTPIECIVKNGYVCILPE